MANAKILTKVTEILKLNNISDILEMVIERHAITRLVLSFKISPKACTKYLNLFSAHDIGRCQRCGSMGRGKRHGAAPMQSGCPISG